MAAAAGEMQPRFRLDVLRFFQDLLGAVATLQTDRRAGGLFLAALNSFLLRNGLDVFSHLPALHQGALHLNHLPEFDLCKSRV